MDLYNKTKPQLQAVVYVKTQMQTRLNLLAFFGVPRILGSSRATLTNKCVIFNKINNFNNKTKPLGFLQGVFLSSGGIVCY